MDTHTVSFDLEAHVDAMTRNGFTVIPGLMDGPALDAFRAALAPLQGAHRGRNSFEGYTTERIYTLVARGKVFEHLAAEPRLLSVIDRFLQPGYLLSASHAICIHPGEAAQAIHFDDGFYRQARPRPSNGISVIGAIDAFTEDNGATVVIPGSHRWSDAQIAALTTAEKVDMAFPVLIPAGAALVFQGALLHGGGANRSNAPRLAFTNQYCEPWARTQENFFLSVPQEIGRDMSPRLQELLGYSIWPPFMGHVTASHPGKTLEAGWRPPVLEHRAS